MENRSLLLLTVWTVVGSFLALLFMCIATFSNKWIYTSETREFPSKTGKEIRTVKQHSGLLISCPIEETIQWIPKEGQNTTEIIAQQGIFPCQAFTELLPPSGEPANNITIAVFFHTKSVLVIPIITCFLLSASLIICTLAQIMPKRRCLVFFNGTLCVVSGLTSLFCLVRFIIAVNDAIFEKHPKNNEVIFTHHYSFSFIMAVISFFLTNCVGVAALYLFIKLEKLAARSEKDRVRHHLRRLGMGMGNNNNTNEIETAFTGEENKAKHGESEAATNQWNDPQYGFDGDEGWQKDPAEDNSQV